MGVQTWHETLMVAQSDGAAITAASATSMLPAHALKTLNPNFFGKLGQKIIIKASGRVSTVVTTPGTLRFDVRFGGTVVFDSLAIALATADAYTNVHWKLWIELSLRAVGSSANLFPDAYLIAPNIAGAPATPPKGSLIAQLPWNTAPAVGNNFNATVSQQVDLFFTQTVATGSITLHTYELISVNEG